MTLINSNADRESVVQVRALRYEVAKRTILSDLDLTVEAGTSMAVTGPSGSGKTTLLMCLAGLLEPTSGAVRIAGTDMTGASADQRAAIRLASIGVIYQFGELMPELTPLENVVLPALLAKVPRRDAYTRGAELLEALGVGALKNVATATVSGGERQRIATARALVTQPSIILADEPTGALDHASGETVADLLFSLPRRFGCALLVVTHNQLIAARADSIVTVVDGRLLENAR